MGTSRSFASLFVSAALLLSCDRSAPGSATGSEETVVIAPRILLDDGVTLPVVDSVRVVVLNANSPGAEPYYERMIPWSAHGDTIRGIPSNASVKLRIEGIEVQTDGTQAVWWSGTATASFSGTQNLSVRSLPVPVAIGDTAAPAILGRVGDTIENTDARARLVWRVREDSAFDVVVGGDTLRPSGDSVVLDFPWGGGDSLPLVARFRDRTGNVAFDSVLVVRRRRVAAPRFSRAAGSYHDTLRVAIDDSTPDAAIEWSDDGGTSWKRYDTALVIRSDAHLLARAGRPGWTSSQVVSADYVVRAAAPEFSVPSGTSGFDLLTVRFSSRTPSVRFQLWDFASSVWRDVPDSVVVGGRSTLRVRCVKPGLAESEASIAGYDVRADSAAISLASGRYETSRKVWLSTRTQGAAIRYTLDGSEPTDSSARFRDSIAIDTATTLRAKVFKNGLVSSATTSAAYVLVVGGGIRSSAPLDATRHALRTLLTGTRPDGEIHCAHGMILPDRNSPSCKDSIDIGDFGDTINAVMYSKENPRLEPTRAVFVYTQAGWNRAIRYGSMTDPRDGRVYWTVDVGGQVWMAENLAYQTSQSSCYAADDANCAIWGRLYSWMAVMAGETSSASIPSRVRGVCPEGWHVPSDSEWLALSAAVGSSVGAYKSSMGWPLSGSAGQDPYGLRVLPSGYAASSGSLGASYSYMGQGSATYFWTSTLSGTLPLYRSVDRQSATLGRGEGNMAYGFSVRCLQDVADTSTLLKTLVVTPGTLVPTFSPGRMEYVDTVPAGLAAVRVRAVALASSGAVVRINGGADTIVDLSKDSLVRIEVANAGSTRVYTVQVVHRPDTVATPRIAPATGVYTQARSVEIASSTPGATIRYTLDGSAPTPTSAVYSGAFVLGSPTQVRAIATKPGMASSKEAKAVLEIVPWNPAIVYGSATDDRDGRTYRTVVVGGRTWLAENLAWAGSGAVVGSCLSRSTDSCAKYGRLYTREETMAGEAASSASPSGVKGICPRGWHLPSHAEWQSLVAAASGSGGVGMRLRSAVGWRDAPGDTAMADMYGFRILPAGHALGTSSTSMVDLVQYWTATETPPLGGDVVTFGRSGGVSWGFNDQSIGFPVRCTEDW